MIDIQKIDHIGIRIREKRRSIAFYEHLGFELIVDTGFEKGHPIMMRHPSGVVLNLLGPSTEEKDENVLMDMERRFAGYTHMALKIGSLANTEAFLAVNGGAKLVHPGGAKLVHLTLCGTRCWGVVPVVHRRDPRCFV